LFSPGFPVSSCNKTDPHDITEILLQVALSIIKRNQPKLLMKTTYVLYAIGRNKATPKRARIDEYSAKLFDAVYENNFKLAHW
jgi:hypothetical protein